MLGDATGFTGRDVGFANHVQQRSFAVVDVTHDGHDRRTRLHLLGLVFDVEFDLLDRRVNDAAAAFAFFNFETETVLGANFLRDCLRQSID